MADDWKPDAPIAETFVWFHGKCFRIYTFERNSSAVGCGGQRFQETHVHEWADGQRGEWLHQLHGIGIAFHCIVAAEFAREGRYDQEEYEANSYELAQKVLNDAARRARANATE